MPSYQHHQPGLPRFQLVLSSFLQHDGLPFADVLPEERIQQAFVDADATFAHDQNDVYTPAVTLWAFLSQVLFKGEMRSCLAAVGRVIVLCVALGRQAAHKGTIMFVVDLPVSRVADRGGGGWIPVPGVSDPAPGNTNWD